MATRSTRVSVLVPAYNAAAFLDRSLGSALAQTLTDLEVVVVDDGSTDATADVANAIAGRDERVRVFRNEHNVGIAETRNRAVTHATGEWLAVLDADDAWLPGRLECLLAHAGDADVVSDDLRVIHPSERGEQKPTSYLAFKSFVCERPTRLTLAALVAHELGFLKPLVRREFLLDKGLRYDARWTVGEDFFLYIELLAAGARWIQTPEAYYVYSLRDESSSRSSTVFSVWEQGGQMVDDLQRRPEIQANRPARNALARFEQRRRARVAAQIVRDALRERRFHDLVVLLATRPSYLYLLPLKILEAISVRGRRRLRHPLRPPPARLMG